MDDIIEKHMCELRQTNKRFWRVIILLFLIILGLELTRLFVLDARVHALVVRLDACQRQKGVIIPYAYKPGQTVYPANIAETQHAD